MARPAPAATAPAPGARPPSRSRPGRPTPAARTGVAVYDSYQEPGWMIFGGTSVSSPIIAATFALGGRPSPGTYPASYPYAHPARLFDVDRKSTRLHSTHEWRS